MATAGSGATPNRDMQATTMKGRTSKVRPYLLSFYAGNTRNSPLPNRQ